MRSGAESGEQKQMKSRVSVKREGTIYATRREAASKEDKNQTWSQALACVESVCSRLVSALLWEDSFIFSLVAASILSLALLDFRFVLESNELSDLAA